LKLRIAGGVIAVAALAVAFTLLPIGPWVVALVTRVRAMGSAGVALFAGAYLLFSLVFIPVGLMRVAAGFLYGMAGGAALVLPLDSLGGLIGFLLARTTLKERVERRVRSHPKLAALDAATARSGFWLVIMLRVTPALPFSGVNYALGVSRVRTSTFVIASLLGLVPVTMAFLQLGALLPDVAALGSARPLMGSWILWATVGATAVVGAVMIVVARRIMRGVQSAPAAPAGDRPPAQP